MSREKLAIAGITLVSEIPEDITTIKSIGKDSAIAILFVLATFRARPINGTFPF